MGVAFPYKEAITNASSLIGPRTAHVTRGQPVSSYYLEKKAKLPKQKG